MEYMRSTTLGTTLRSAILIYLTRGERGNEGIKRKGKDESEFSAKKRGMDIFWNHTVQSMLSSMECFSSVTAASQSEPVSFPERSIDVCKQIQLWRNSRRNFQVYSVKNIFWTLGSLRKTLFISKCIYPRESRRRKWKCCRWMQNKTVVDACKSGNGNSKTPTRKQSTGVARKSQGKPTEVTFKPTTVSLNKSATFAFGSPEAKPIFQPGNRQTKVAIATSAATSGKKLKLKSPKIFKPIISGTAVNEGKPKTPVARKSFAAITIAEKRPKTPALPARKSMAVTPFRFLPANIPATPTPTPKKKFDLQASLAKPLPYKPHTGKLKPISSYKEECKPTVSEAKLKSHKVDVKNVKVVSREERRKKGLRDRENKRATTLSRRRGLAC